MNGYEALRNGVAWLDLDSRGRFYAKGEDRARLLHAMSTNQIEQMKPGNGVYTFFLNAQGRIVSDAFVLCLDDALLLDTEPESHQTLMQHLDKFIIADDVTLEDARKSLAVIGVEGPGAADLQLSGAVKAPFAVTGVGFRLYVSPAEKADWIAKLEAAGAVGATAEEQKVVRLERFHPRYGDDITEKNLVQETQLLNAVSFSKGCYLGQEIVERVRSRGQVHRMLVPLYLDSAASLAKGTPVMAGETAAGELMSSAFSPTLGKSVGFAYVRGEHASVGSQLRVGDAPAEVAAAKGV